MDFDSDLANQSDWIQNQSEKVGRDYMAVEFQKVVSQVLRLLSSKLLSVVISSLPFWLT